MLRKFLIGVALLLATLSQVDHSVRAEAAGKVVCYYDSRSFIREGEFYVSYFTPTRRSTGGGGGGNRST